MRKPVLTLHECCTVLRANGFRCSPNSVKQKIKSEIYPFGRITSVGPTGREETEIFWADVEEWIRGKRAGEFDVPPEQG